MHACRSTLEDPTYLWSRLNASGDPEIDELRVIEIRTRADHLLYHSPVMELTRWTPDGAAIVARDSRDEEGQYVRIPLNGGAAETLLKLTPEDDRRGDLSPDGRTMLLSRVGASGDRDLVAIDVATGAERWARRASSDDAEPRWTPDGSGVVFITDLTGCEALALLRVKDGAPASTPETVMPLAGKRVHSYGFGPDRTLLMHERAYPYSTFIATLGNLAAAEARVLRPSRCDVAMGADWSTDGARIAYVAGRPAPGARARLVVEQPDGLERVEVPLKDPFVEFAQTSWAPHGHRIAVLYRTGLPLTGGAVEVLAVVDGQRTTEVIRDPLRPLNDPSWAPDGQAIYVRSGQEILHINMQAIPFVTRTVYRPPAGEALDRGLDVSRDGAIAVGHSIGQSNARTCRVRVRPRDDSIGSSQDFEGSCQSLSWAPDGRQMLIGTGPRQGESALFVYDHAGGTVRRLSLAAPQPNLWQLSLHPRGDQLLLMAGPPAQPPNIIQIRGLR